KRQELVKIPDTSKMKVEIKVHESHVGQVKVGHTAYVVLDSMPDQRFRGEVTKVGILPDSQSRWGNPNLKVYSTEIVITDDLPDVKPGVSARAEIIVTKIDDALAVPIQAVTSLKGKQVCYVKGAGDPKPKEVQVGLFNNKFIEINNGLEVGDRILLAPPIAADTDLDGGVVAEGDEVEVTEGKEREKGAGDQRKKSGGKPEGRNRPGGGRPEGGDRRSGGGRPGQGSTGGGRPG
ncbi:MAG: efflux RND transporter periplasmic adaptor subunit, partial [Verrucomicrobiota bacterium]